MKISCIVHTYNSEDYVEKALASVEWVDELIVVDMESTDRTLEIAKKFTQVIYHQPKVERVDGIRNKFVAKASNEWVLVLDSDEFLAADAQDNILDLITKYGDQFDAFTIPRFNYIAGQIMQGSGWYPAPQIRLFRKGALSWGDSNHILPKVVTGSHRLMELEPPDCLHIHHRNYEDLRHFISKQTDYAVTDSYNPDPEQYDFATYIAMAYENLARHQDPETDGDLSYALSLLMAWDAIIRGIINWDSLTPRPPLPHLLALPVAGRRLSMARIRLRKFLRRHHSINHLTGRVQYRWKVIRTFFTNMRHPFRK